MAPGCFSGLTLAQAACDEVSRGGEDGGAGGILRGDRPVASTI